jgi:hypothetical protein
MGNVAQTNQMASLLLLGVCGAWYDYARGQLARGPFVLLLAFLSSILVLTQSRTGLLSATVVAIFLLVKLHQNRATSAWRTPATAVVTWIALIWSLAVAVPWVNEATLLGGNRQIGLLDPNSRQLIWRQIGQAIAESPWWGYGWNQTASAQNVGALVHPGELSVTYAHNLPLDLIAWCGVPLGGALLGLMLWWFFSRAWRVASLPAVAAFTALLPIAIHSQLEFPFAYGYFLVTAGILVGFVEAHLSPSAKTIALSTGVLLGTALLWGLTGLFATWEYIQAEEDFRVVRFEGLKMGTTPVGYEPPKIYLLTQLGTMLEAARLQPHPDMSASEIETLRVVARRFPFGSLGYRYALALALNGQLGQAQQQLQVMRGMYGERYYRAVLQDLRERQAQDPRLAALLVELDTQQ